MHCNRRKDKSLFAVLLSVGSSFYTASAKSSRSLDKISLKHSGVEVLDAIDCVSQPISENGSKITHSPRNTHSPTYEKRAQLDRYPSVSGRANDQRVAATSAGGTVNIRLKTDVRNSTPPAVPLMKDTAHPTTSPRVSAAQCLCSLLVPIRCNRPSVVTTEAIISFDATMISKNITTPAPVSPTTPSQNSQPTIQSMRRYSQCTASRHGIMLNDSYGSVAVFLRQSR